MPAYRLDTFVVPLTVRDTFVARVLETHEVLRRQPGFVRDALMEMPDGSEAVRIATLAEWEDERSMGPAGDAVHALRERTGFDPIAFIRSNGVEADFRVYAPLDERQQEAEAEPSTP